MKMSNNVLVVHPYLNLCLVNLMIKRPYSYDPSKCLHFKRRNDICRYAFFRPVELSP